MNVEQFYQMTLMLQAHLTSFDQIIQNIKGTWNRQGEQKFS